MNPKNPNKFPPIVIGTFVLLVASFIAFGYISLNASAELADAREKQKSDQELQQVLQELVLHTGDRLSQDDLTQLVKQNFGAGHIVKQANNQLLIDGVVLQFSDGKLTKVTSLDTTN